MTSDLGPHGHF